MNTPPVERLVGVFVVEFDDAPIQSHAASPYPIAAEAGPDRVIRSGASPRRKPE